MDMHPREMRPRAPPIATVPTRPRTVLSCREYFLHSVSKPPPPSPTPRPPQVSSDSNLIAWFIVFFLDIELLDLTSSASSTTSTSSTSSTSSSTSSTPTSSSTPTTSVSTPDAKPSTSVDSVTMMRRTGQRRQPCQYGAAKAGTKTTGATKRRRPDHDRDRDDRKETTTKTTAIVTRRQWRRPRLRRQRGDDSTTSNSATTMRKEGRKAYIEQLEQTTTNPQTALTFSLERSTRCHH